MTTGTAHKTAATSNDDVGAAGVCTADVLIAPTEETDVEAEEEKRTEVAEVAPQEETADSKSRSVQSARAPLIYQNIESPTCRTETGARSASQAEA